jgi:CubicO group peptidase (beta-lactamase class C family)
MAPKVTIPFDQPSLGFADTKTRRLANRNTVHRIGSVTKPFAAVMLMQLVAAGRVRMSDPVERYLPKSAGSPPSRRTPRRSPSCSSQR